MSARTARPRSAETAKRALIGAAKQVFARSGFRGGRVHEIAELAGLNVSLISHYFGGKEGLYRECLREFSAERLSVLDHYMTSPGSVEEFKVRLEMLVDRLLQEHLNEPEVVTILLRDIDEKELWGKELESLLFSFTTKLSGFFALAKKRKLLRANVDPMTAASLIYLGFSGLVQTAAHLERTSGIRIRDEAVRKTIVKRTLDIVFNGILPER